MRADGNWAPENAAHATATNCRRSICGQPRRRWSRQSITGLSQPLEAPVSGHASPALGLVPDVGDIDFGSVAIGQPTGAVLLPGESCTVELRLSPSARRALGLASKSPRARAHRRRPALSTMSWRPGVSSVGCMWNRPRPCARVVPNGGTSRRHGRGLLQARLKRILHHPAGAYKGGLMWILTMVGSMVSFCSRPRPRPRTENGSPSVPAGLAEDAGRWTTAPHVSVTGNSPGSHQDVRRRRPRWWFVRTRRLGNKPAIRPPVAGMR